MPSKLREDAERIWQAGVAAVRPERLMADQIEVAGGNFFAGALELPLGKFRRIAVIGAGKAGAGMVRGLENALGERLLAEKNVSGLVCVPENSVAPTQAIGLVSGRPAGVNEPRPEGAAAARNILQLVSELGPDDLCLCLISGGGSALLPAPIDGISLDQKTAITKLLSATGATINQLNTVRSAISQIKGGGLARACRAGALVTLVLSDVLGDPLDVIASGPTVPTSTGPKDALRVLEELGLTDNPAAAPVVTKLRELAKRESTTPPPPTTEVHNLILANNASAVDAAGMEAERLGYNHAMTSATHSEGSAEEVGRHLASMAKQMRDQPGPNCLITGGEPTVTLAPSEIRGRGGRNQQLVLTALHELGDCHRVALLSGGTDGEDGPTDAAGAVIDPQVAQRAKELQLDATDALRRNDAYPFFEACGGLLCSGPTHTNVCDLRVVTVEQQE